MNGAALPLDLDPPVITTKAIGPTEIEQRIGNTVADAAIMVCAGVGDWESDGRLAPATRAQAGALFVELFQLQESTLGELDFAAVARAEGKRAIMRRHGAVLAQHYGATLSGAALDRVLDEIIDWPLGILRKVTAAERAWAN
jgi:hypothetical protein